MRYDEFVVSWRRHFESARPFLMLGAPDELLHLGSMSRHRGVRLMGAGLGQVDPYTISAKVEWRWDALQSARTTTTEEDLVAMVLGDADRVKTDPPWLRVDVSLDARAHLDARLQLPEPVTWNRWALEISARLEAMLPAHIGRDSDGAILGWRGDPSVELRCGAGGQLFLTGVGIAAWQAIELPRIWDDPERPRDPEVDPQLADLARRLRSALDVWAEALATLEIGGRVH